jgi:hypothetical protein
LLRGHGKFAIQVANFAAHPQDGGVVEGQVPGDEVVMQLGQTVTFLLQGSFVAGVRVRRGLLQGIWFGCGGGAGRDTRRRGLFRIGSISCPVSRASKGGSARSRCWHAAEKMPPRGLLPTVWLDSRQPRSTIWQEAVSRELVRSCRAGGWRHRMVSVI